MLQSLFIICGCIFGVKTTEVSDGKYVLTSSGSAEFVSSFEDLKTKCKNSWPLEIYDENVVALLKKLKLNTQQHGILLGMTRGTNSWMWSDGTTYSETPSGNIKNQEGNGDGSTRVVACVALDNLKGTYFAKTIFDSAYVLCCNETNVDKCPGWFNNGLCYFKPSSTTFKWFEAHNECIQNEASMPKFTNSEPNFNSSFFDNKVYWVSLSRSSWIWTHTGKVVTFNKWSSGQPDNSGTLNCATTNSDGSEWKITDCSGTYHVVCMRGTNGSSQPTTSTSTKSSIYNPTENNETTNQSLISKPGITIITTSSKESFVEGSLSEGAKAGIGVGVCLLLIIIITIAAVFIFKYFHRIKNAFKRSNKRNPLSPEDHLTTYSTPVVKNPRNTISPGIGSNPLEYADLDFEKQFD